MLSKQLEQIRKRIERSKRRYREKSKVNRAFDIKFKFADFPNSEKFVETVSNIVHSSDKENIDNKTSRSLRLME